MKLETKNLKKTTIWGGIGAAVFLVLLMALMPMTSLAGTAPQVAADFSEESEADAKNDQFALPTAEIDNNGLSDYDPADELIGMRALTQKAFNTDEGIEVLQYTDPVHFVSTEGTWEEIDTSLVSTPFGWEVTDNIYKSAFSTDVSNGVVFQAHDNVDPLVVGVNPVVVTMDPAGEATLPYRVGQVDNTPETGGNVIRYPIGDGIDLDYKVEVTQMKQNLILREQPNLDPDAEAWFGLSETLRLPAGHALFIGDIQVDEEIQMTQESLQVRNIETGELLVVFPAPYATDASRLNVTMATYFVSVMGTQVTLVTAVDTGWLMDENLTYPVVIDPSVQKTSSSRGDCYTYYAYCYNDNMPYLYRYYARLYYMPWYKFSFSSASAPPTGATADKIEWKSYVYYRSWSSSGTVTAAMLENCGTSTTYSWTIPTASCSGTISASYLSAGYGGTNQRKLISSLWNSASIGSYPTGTGWKTMTICSSSTACSSGTGSTIFSAANNAGTIGMGLRHTTNNYFYMYANNAGSYNSYLKITYSGGSDTTPPTADFVPYDGITSYKEGARTFFITLSDSSGIDTTASGNTRLYYSLNGGTYSSVSATSIGSCSSTATKCQFKATTASISVGDDVDYFWVYQDLATSGSNMGSMPSGATGSVSSATAPSSPYNFDVDDVANAGNDMKFTVLVKQRSAYSSYSPSKFFDQQMTYYEDSDEYVFEFDTSACGTGSNSCFYTSSYYFYALWTMRWTTAPSSGYNGFGGTQSGAMDMHQTDGGYLSISANNGPGMNLIYLYDSTLNKWAMVGLDTATGIDDPLTGGTTKSHRSTYGYTKAWNIKIPGAITGTAGKFDFNATYSTSKANYMCQGSNGFAYFFRSTSSNAQCTSGYYYAYSTYYRWTGFAIGTGYYGSLSSSGGVSWKVAKVAPEPDTTAPEMEFSPMLDSHARDRTFSLKISDAGEPPVGLNVSTTAGVGPTLYYTITDADGTVGTQQSKILSPVGTTRASCALSQCEWSATLSELERGSSVSYQFYAEDVQTSAMGGPNTNTSSSSSFEVGDPNKVFVVEWHDWGYMNNIYECDVQVLLYDVTNEIEFKYADDCEAYYDYSVIGYQDGTRSKGATIDGDKAGYLAGSNPFTSNFRIATDGSNHGWEKFDLGLTEITNYNVAIQGSSNGYPYGYYCVSSYYWNQYKAGCDANIDLPDGFEFEYFGTTFDGDNSNSRVMISRFGAMYLKSTSSTSPERAITTWYTNMPDLPYSSNSYSRPNLMAPFWGYYSSYYCYSNSNTDCSVRYRIMPFEGKGTDIDSDIVTPTSWDLIDSPIRVNPSGDYLSVSADLTIEPGVVVQVANGKGISFDGACDALTVNGNATDHVRFEGQQGNTWTGLAFTQGCSTATGTDDRHSLSYVDFANTTDSAISAGSRHGGAPSTNSNVGNFTMDHATFTNVGGAVSHGSGDGTGFLISDSSVDNSADSCFDFPTDAVVSLYEVDMDGCNTDNNAGGGAIVNDGGSTAGSLAIENVTADNAWGSMVSTDLLTVSISNLSGAHSAAQSGAALSSTANGAGSTLSVSNMDAQNYASVTIEALDSYSVDSADFGSASMTISPGGSSSTANGAWGDDASLSNLNAGGLSMARTAPKMTNVDLGSGALSVSGNSPTTDSTNGNNVDAGGISFSGCGYNYNFNGMDLDANGADSYLSSSCSSSNAPNTIIVYGGSIATAASGANNVIYARNSKITVGEVDITGQTAMGNSVAKASSNGQISLIDVTWRGNDCATASGWAGNSVCWVTISSSSGSMYFGGLADVGVYKNVNVSGVVTKVYKPNHVVTTEVVDGAGATVTGIHRHVTDAAGQVDAWVIVEGVTGQSLTSTSYANHNLFAWGAAGMNETYDEPFTIGDSIELELFPAPIDFDQPNMDCYWLSQNETTSAADPEGDGTYIFDETPMTLSADLTIDGCTITLMGASLKVKSDATNSPELIINSGGVVQLNVSSTNKKGTIKAVSSAYPMNIDIQDGTLWVDGGIIRDHAVDASTGVALNVGSGAVLKMTNGGTIFGMAATSDAIASVGIMGGDLQGDQMNFVNSGNTGTALLFNDATSTATNVAVSGAAIGISSINAAPQIDGFTIVDSTTGVKVYGGMSLPTLYRSTLLSGQNRGWTTHAIDLSAFLGDDYLQLGYNSVYGGGNAHPTYNYATSKYFMITDRRWVEFNVDTDGDGTGDTLVNQSSMDAAAKEQPGYWDGTGGGSNSGYAGWNYYNCNYYGYSYNPAYYNYNYFYYLINYGPYSNNGGYNNYPTDFGYRWEGGDSSAMYYPLQYWGYYYNSYHGGQGVMKPPEGYNGMWSNYNVCLNYAYTYYNSPGDQNRMAFPILDMSNTGTVANGNTVTGDIVGATLYIDMLHNRADNYQDRLEIIARSSNDASNMGDWAREAGTPSFKNGNIDLANDGVVIGGNYAAATFENIDVDTPSSAGFRVTGGAATTTVNGLVVDGGNYGVIVSLTGAGKVDLSNVALTNQALSGVTYLRDISGGVAGSISGSSGSAIEYGSATTKPVDYESLTLSGNAVGIKAGGSGALTLTDSTFANTNDFVISGSSAVNFIDGAVDETSVDVTGSGIFTRSRSLEVTLTADASNIVGANVYLMDANSKITGSAVTDASGIAGGLLYTTAVVDSSGATWPALSGYTMSSVAEVDYSSTKMDFRYASGSVSLSNTTSSTDALAMTTADIMPHRVCYQYSSSSYTMIASCQTFISTSSPEEYDNDGDGTTDAWEYNYFGGADDDMSGRTVMVDVAFMYVTGGSTSQNWNGTTVIATGAYDYYGYQRWTSTYPYNASWYMEDSTVLALGETGQGAAIGIGFGYYAWSDINPWFVNNTIVNLASIAAGDEYGNRMPAYFKVEDNTLIGFKTPEKKNAIYYEEMAIIDASVDDLSVKNNHISGFTVGLYIRNTPYSYYYASSTWGSDDAVISGNTFEDIGTIPIWYGINSYADDNKIDGNTFKGSTNPWYDVYTQNYRTVGIEISNNVHENAEQAIYMRGALDWNIHDNTIAGNKNSAHPGIYALNGYGEIADNTLVDADGGIMIDGIRTGQSASVTGNSISTSSGRTAPSAVGIWAEDCGSSVLETGSNDVTTVMNALVVDDCDVEDTGSVFRGTGGAGSTSWSVDVMASYYSPQNVTVNEGDTVRWRAKEYYNNSGTGETHTVTSNDSSGGVPLFDSSTMNLGSTFTHVFSTAGTYEYHCSNHGWMYGKVVVTAGSGASFTAYGINVAGSNDDLTLNGTDVGGFSTGITQTGGKLMLKGGADIGGVSYAADLNGVDVSTDGASLTANGTVGVGLYLTNGGSLDLAGLNTDAAYGVYTDGVDFRWNGGDAEGGVALYATNAAEGSIENMTWASATTQIYAGAYTVVTSVGNTLDPSKLSVDGTAVVHEGNLLDLATDRTRDVGGNASATEDMGLLIQSTDKAKAAYASPSFRTNYMAVDGDTGDWTANPLNPSDDAMPGLMSGDGSNDMLVTWDSQKLYLAITGESMDNGDLMVYIDSSNGGTTTSADWYGTHNLPFGADHMFWAEDGSDAPNDGDSTWTWGLKSYGLTSTFQDSSAGCTGMDAYIGHSGNSNTEIAIPWSCLGSPDGTVRLLAIVQAESAQDVTTVHPSQATSGSGSETFNTPIEITLNQGDLGDGSMDDFLLIYRSYVGSNTPSAAKDYDLMALVDADCGNDWGTIEDINMSTNRAESLTIKRACPVIVAPSFVTVTTQGNNLTGTGYMVGFEDMPMQTIPLTPYGSDADTLAPFLDWSIVDHPNPAFAPTSLLSYNQWGVLGMTIPLDLDGDGVDDYNMPIGNDHLVNLSVHENQFGQYTVFLTLTDEHGLTDLGILTVVIVPVNDAPIIWNPARTDGLPVFVTDSAANPNVADEGFGSITIPLGSTANSPGSFVVDQANEQPQTYTWAASVPASCDAFGVSVTSNELTITENQANELGGECPITLYLADNGTDAFPVHYVHPLLGVDIYGWTFNDAFPRAVTFRVNPVNDAPVVRDYDHTAGHVITDGTGTSVALPWRIIVDEDTTDVDLLTFDLAEMKEDNDHLDSELSWEFESTSNCVWENYFSDISISGDEIGFTLIPDATTTAPPEEIDYLDDGGIHQARPAGGDYCAIRMFLNDTANAPSHTPNYNYDTASYSQQGDEVLLYIQVKNTPEPVADYTFEAGSGFDFHGVSHIMPGSKVPVSVDITHGGDAPPYKYDHLLKVEFYTNGHATGEALQNTVFLEAPAHNATTTVKIQNLQIMDGTTKVTVYLDVMTCVAENCPAPGDAVLSDFISNTPPAHRCDNQPNVAWSCPGDHATTSLRRPALEDSNFSNNIMSNTNPQTGTLSSGDELPERVDLIGAAAVPSFAPGLLVVSLIGMFVAGLAGANRRGDFEEELEEMEDDEAAVSPVIATILMVAITVVLSGVIYVWASSLANTDAKTVPRVGMKVVEVEPDDANGYWRLDVTQAKTELATQAVIVQVHWASGFYETSLANQTTYGFVPSNVPTDVIAPITVTFADNVECDQQGKNCKSTFGVGDSIIIKSHDDAGDKMNDVRVVIRYSPGVGKAATLQEFRGLH